MDDFIKNYSFLTIQIVKLETLAGIRMDNISLINSTCKLS